MKIAVIFGGMSTEHDVSIVSGTSIIKNLDQSKYEVCPIYINQKGNWFYFKKKIEEIGEVQVGDQLTDLELISNPMEVLKTMDCLFPVLHGLYGEDGTIQGMFELLQKPYVGCHVLGSSVSMDKAYTKVIFNTANLKQVEYVYLKQNKERYIYVDSNFNEIVYSIEEIGTIVEQKLSYPMFIKPSNSGSSVGISKAKDRNELKEAIIQAGKYDDKIIIEQGIDAREIECAVLGNEEVTASCLGEILSAEEFYSFDSKYKNEESRTVIPASLSEELTNEIRTLAVKAFKSVNGRGLARVDFFVDRKTNEVYINEINTMPGFTKISMYPKLFEASNLPYPKLLDRLIELAIE